MEHDISLIATISMGLVLAFIGGMIANKLRLPPLVGYLLAGVALGPFTPGFVGDAHIAGQLAEIGVMLLMFGVGLHFSINDLLAVRGIAIPGAIAQIAVATLFGVALAHLWGWGLGAGLVFGLALSVASTVVLLRALEQRNELDSVNGKIAVGWLIVEDLAMVLALVLLPALAGALGADGGSRGVASQLSGDSVWLTLVLTLGKVALFTALVFVVGTRAVPWMLKHVARTGSRELFTLSVLATALGIAYGSAELFGVSFALGAFFAGIVLSESDFSHKAAADSLPFQDAFAVLFFVSVGMLFDPRILVQEPGAVVSVLLIILIGKSIVAFAIVQMMGYPVSTALMVSACLAQIGEFSFILAGLGISLGVLPERGRDLILAGALLSVAVNPLAFATVTPINNFIRRRRRMMSRVEPAQDLKLARLQAVLDANKQVGEKAAIQPDELISRWPVFADLDLAMRAELLTYFKPRSAVPGERLIHKGDAADEVFFISSGMVEVSVGGRRIRLGPGDFFGEMALLSGAPRSADVTAIDYCQLLTLGVKDFQGFVSKHPELRAKLDDVAAARAAMNKTPEVASAGDVPGAPR